MKRTILLVVLGLAVITGGFLIVRGRSSAPASPVASGCATQSFGPGSSGHCVTDLQTMANFMQTDNLTQCPFTGGKVIASDGTYSQATADQIKVIQNWFNCYYKEEGDSANLPADGTVTPQTWHYLCSYAYSFPSKASSSPSPYRQQSLAAGKDAGCTL